MAERAYLTLKAGCTFFEQRAAEQPMPCRDSARIAYTRMVGNRLRELDRFLSVLIEDVAARLDSRGHDARALARINNTARKLRMVQDWSGAAADDEARLRAIGRITACLHHCAGTIHLLSLHDDVCLARGRASTGLQTGKGSRLQIDPQTIMAICAFYRVLAARLMALPTASGARS